MTFFLTKYWVKKFSACLTASVSSCYWAPDQILSHKEAENSGCTKLSKTDVSPAVINLTITWPSIHLYHLFLRSLSRSPYGQMWLKTFSSCFLLLIQMFCCFLCELVHLLCKIREGSSLVLTTFMCTCYINCAFLLSSVCRGPNVRKTIRVRIFFIFSPLYWLFKITNWHLCNVT